MKNEIIPLFASNIFMYELNIDNKKIINFLKKINYDEIKFNHKSYISIENDLFKFKELKILKKEIIKCLKNYYENVIQYDCNFKILNSWATKINPGGYSQFHHHSHSFLSCVYYPKGNIGYNIKFTNRNLDYFWDLPVKKYNIFNSNSWTINVKENTLLIFKSDILHRIEPNESSEDRYSLAFNINPDGYVGTKDSKVKF